MGKEFSKTTIELANKISKKDFEQIYYSNSTNVVCKIFGITTYNIISLLKFWGLPRKTRNEACRLKSTLNFKKPPALINSISKEELKKFYIDENHGFTETCRHFLIDPKHSGSLTTLIKRYGLTKTAEQIETAKKASTVRTCLERYGTTNGGWTAQAQEKIKQTNLEKYGVEYSWQSENSKLKANKTKLKKFGRIDVGQFGTEEHNNAIKAKYGVDHPMESDEIKQRLDEHMIKKYGVNRYAKTLEFHKKARKLYEYNTEKFDSSWELALWIYATDHNEEIIRCPIILEYEYNNTVHKYCPDFSYNGELIEVKGDHLFRKLKEAGTLENAKYKCMKLNNIKVLTKKDIKFALIYCIDKYNTKNWYSQFIINNRKENTTNE